MFSCSSCGPLSHVDIEYAYSLTGICPVFLFRSSMCDWIGRKVFLRQQHTYLICIFPPYIIFLYEKSRFFLLLRFAIHVHNFSVVYQIQKRTYAVGVSEDRFLSVSSSYSFASSFPVQYIPAFEQFINVVNLSSEWKNGGISIGSEMTSSGGGGGALITVNERTVSCYADTICATVNHSRILLFVFYAPLKPLTQAHAVFECTHVMEGAITKDYKFI